MKFHTLRVWPNGEFGSGLVKRFRPEFVTPQEKESIHQSYSWTKSELHTILDAIACYGSLTAALEALAPGVYPATLEEITQLGLSNVPNSHKRQKRGTGGLTSYARRMIRNGCYLMGKWAGKRAIAMTTVTIPSLPDEIYKEVVNNWAEITRVFTQWLHRKLKAVGGCPWVIGVVEIQEKRFQREGRLPLHLHLVHQSRVKKGYTLTKQDVLNAWERAVCARVPECRGYSFASSTRIEGVRKDVSHYLSKYMSKGISQETAERVPPDWKLPSSWWIGVGDFKASIKRLIVYRTDEVSTAVWNAAISKHQKLTQVYLITTPGNYGEILVGISGKMSNSLTRMLQNQNYQEFIEAIG